jgi:Integrase zinc binding domain
VKVIRGAYTECRKGRSGEKFFANKIVQRVVPKQLHDRHVIDWYHVTLCHPGINRAEESIGQHLFRPKMQDQITKYVQACPTCRKNKRQVKKYGWLPPKEAEAIPWDKMCIA